MKFVKQSLKSGLSVSRRCTKHRRVKNVYRCNLALANFILLLAASGGCVEQSNPGSTPADPRRSSVVQLYEECAPSAVDMTGYSPNPAGYYDIGVGSGTVIHEDGYILTANHVARDELGGPPNMVHFENGKDYRYRIFKRLGDDIALVKIDVDQRLKPMKLGRSSSLVPGEPIIIIGNPKGFRHTVVPGIIAGLNRDGPEVFIPGMIQVCAPINGGNSGGPVINAEGELVGVIQSMMETADNIGFAVPLDHIRRRCTERMALERSRGLWHGMTVDPSDVAQVVDVREGSPAARAGVKQGDVIRRTGSLSVRDSIHFCLAVAELQEGDVLPLELERRGRTMKLSLTVERLPGRPAEAISGLINGLDFTVYRGEWKNLPDFDKLTPGRTGHTDTIPGQAWEEETGPFALKLTGYIEVPTNGVFNFYVSSDDGSKLWIGDRLVVDNDGLHGAVERDGWIVLDKGLHPITVDFFEAGGAKSLAVSYDGPEIGKRMLPANILFRKPAAQSGNTATGG